jgi:large subunit ribosomal protein L6
MSRIGKKPVVIPKDVQVDVQGQTIRLKGPKGELSWDFSSSAQVALVQGAEGQEIQVTVRQPEEKEERALWGTTRATIASMLEGVTNGYTKSLEINGVGFRANLSGKKLVLTVGFSHDIDFTVPEGIAVKVEKNIITVTGIDKQLVGETASRIRRIKPPEPYLGKGIKYTDEVVRRKVGKAATKAAE